MSNPVPFDARVVRAHTTRTHDRVANLMDSATAAEAAQGTWEFTGNHYVAAPRISSTDASVHSLNVLHRGLGGLVSWSAGQAGTLREPLLRVRLAVDGVDLPLEALRWERIDRWIPRWRAQLSSDLAVTGTICFPGGPDPVIRGGVWTIEAENRGRQERAVEIMIDCVWRYSLLELASARPLHTTNRLVRGLLHEGVALETGPESHGVAIAFTAGSGGALRWTRDDEAWSDPDPGAELQAETGALLRFQLTRSLAVRAGRSASAAFYVGAASERDGALATAEYHARIGADELVRLARLDLSRLARRTRDPAFAGLLNRNLLFACYAGLARAIDDDRIYFVRSRDPLHGGCAVFNEREALLWLLPALTAADAFMAREALLRAFEQYSHRAGERWHYLDGGVLAPGFCLDQFVAYAVALDRYAREARDTSILDEPLVQDVLRELDEILFHRLDGEHFLCATELLPSGEKADYPFVVYDNALVWAYAESLPRIWRRRQGEPPPRFEKSGEEIAAALWQRCTVEMDGMRVLGCASDLRGGIAIYDDPAGSLRLLPHLGFCEADDPIWSNTMDLLHSKVYPLWLGGRAVPGLAGRSRADRGSMAALCADLLTTRRDAALQTLRRLRLEGGVACETYDPDTGRTLDGPFDAPLAAHLAWALLAETSARPGTPRERQRA